MPRDLRLLILLAPCVLVALLTGCFGDDDDHDDIGPPVPPPYELPDDADGLAADFGIFYSDRDLEHYALILHEDFAFIAQDGETYDRAGEIEVCNRMFHEMQGNDGTSFSNITVEYMLGQNAWSAVPDDDPLFGDVAGAMLRSYDVFISFKISGVALTYEVKGLATFYVLATDDGYQLLGILDQTYGGKATESICWSHVKALF
jgi:hypothetical protein